MVIGYQEKAPGEELAEVAQHLVARKVRCPDCGARLFDARERWFKTDARRATLVIKCWRCTKVIPFISDRDA